jgi:hypothetical protein
LGEEPEDASLAKTLQWALGRMRSAGYPVSSSVTVEVDPDLKIMGYAKTEGEVHIIIVAEWALDSEMLGGLILHELAHIYHTERGSPSHSSKTVEEVLQEAAERDGINERESAALMDVLSDLQNILVDDIVFSCLSGRELKQTGRFFAGWISEQPTGDPVVDAVLLVRNAFAVASLRRRGLTAGMKEMEEGNAKFLSFYGESGQQRFEQLESFLEAARPDWSEAEFRRALMSYFDQVLGLMKERKGLQDLR